MRSRFKGQKGWGCSSVVEHTQSPGSFPRTTKKVCKGVTTMESLDKVGEVTPREPRLPAPGGSSGCPADLILGLSRLEAKELFIPTCAPSHGCELSPGREPVQHSGWGLGPETVTKEDTQVLDVEEGTCTRGWYK